MAKARSTRASKPVSKVDTGGKSHAAKRAQRKKDVRTPGTVEHERRHKMEGKQGTRAEQIGRGKVREERGWFNEMLTGVKKRGPTPTKPRAKKK